MLKIICWLLFAILVGIALVAISPLKNFLHVSGDLSSFVPLLGGVGALLVILALAAKQDKWLKTFMIITGASAAGWPISLYLHEFLFRFFPTEPVTYILVFFILPVTFLAGVFGTLAFGIKRLIFSK
jgi:hypothetical protein